MDTTVDTFEHAGLTVRIVGEEYIDEYYNPRQCANPGTMYVGHPDYELGDEQLPRDGFNPIPCPACDEGVRDLHGPVHERESLGGTVTDYPECARCEGSLEVEPTVDEWLASVDAVAVVPLFLLDHSGLSMRAGSVRWVEDERVTRADTRSAGRFIGDDAGWDTSFVGFLIYDREAVDGLDRERVEAAMRVEVETYTQYLEGDCGGYVVEDAEGTELDSCWGFLGLGPGEYVHDEAREAAEHCRESLKREATEAASMAARDIPTV